MAQWWWSHNTRVCCSAAVMATNHLSEFKTGEPFGYEIVYLNFNLNTIKRWS